MANRLSFLRKARAEPDGIRTSALLLPALFRSDWQHSSSQLPITPNDARWTSSPSGRYSFFDPPFHKEACVCASAQYSCIISLRLLSAMRWMHRCHSGTALPFRPAPYYLQLIDRGGALLLPAPLDLDRRHSSSRLPIRTKRRSLDLLPQRALFVFGPRFRAASPAAKTRFLPRVLTSPAIAPWRRGLHGLHGCDAALSL